MTVIQETKLRNNWRQFSLKWAFLIGLAVTGLVAGSVPGHAGETAPSSRQGPAPQPQPDDWPYPWG